MIIKFQSHRHYYRTKSFLKIKSIIIDCYFKHGGNECKSKGLVELCKDLDVQLPAKIKLDGIREIPSEHRAFENVSENHSISLKTSSVRYSYTLLYRLQN